MTAILAGIFAFSALGAALAGAISDFRRLKISNRLSLIIAGAFVPAAMLALPSLSAVFSYLVGAALIFAISYALFVMNVLGGGDSKMMSALALWIGIKGMPIFLIVMSLSGGLLALVAIILRKHKPFPQITGESWVAQIQKGRSAVPYGIAIATGGIWASLAAGLCSEILNNLKSLFYVAS